MRYSDALNMQQEPSIPVSQSDANEPQIVVGNNKSGKFRGVFSTMAIFIAAPVVALLLTAFVFQSYEVDGPSMETTLQNQDRLLVLKVPRSWARLTGKPYTPERGEIVIFVKRGLSELDGDEKQLIKRVIGVPGDRVVVRDGRYTVYNSEHPDGFNPDENQPYTNNIASFTRGTVDITVAGGEVFVSGDNRINSYDSRDFGTVPDEDLVGRLLVRIFPLNKFESFL